MLMCKKCICVVQTRNCSRWRIERRSRQDSAKSTANEYNMCRDPPIYSNACWHGCGQLRNGPGAVPQERRRAYEETEQLGEDDEGTELSRTPVSMDAKRSQANAMRNAFMVGHDTGGYTWSSQS